MFERLLLLWLLLVSACAYFWPQLAGDSLDPFRAAKPLIPWMMAVTMFAVGAMLPRDEVREVRRRWPQVFWGTLAQYTAMPLLGWLMARLSNLSADYQIGIILVGCVPGAMASNVITMNAKGHTSYSVSLTTCSTLLSPLVVPFTLALAVGRSMPLNLVQVSVELLQQVVVPVLLGFGLAQVWPRFAAIGLRFGPLVANVIILAIIATVVAVNRERLGTGVSVVVAPLLAVNLLGYLAGYLAGTVARQPESMRRALTIEVGMQNAGLGTSLAFRLFPDQPAATVPTALYTFGCVLTAMLLAAYWSGRPTEMSAESDGARVGDSP